MDSLEAEDLLHLVKYKRGIFVKAEFYLIWFKILKWKCIFKSFKWNFPYQIFRHQTFHLESLMMIFIDLYAF